VRPEEGMLGCMREFVRLAILAEKIVESKADWSVKYDAIFGVLGLSSSVAETEVEFQAAFVDRSEEEDVRAYVQSLTKKAYQIGILLIDIGLIDTIPENWKYF